NACETSFVVVADHEIRLAEQNARDCGAIAPEGSADRLIGERGIEPFDLDAGSGKQPVQYLTAGDAADLERNVGAVRAEFKPAVLNGSGYRIGSRHADARAKAQDAVRDLACERST